MLGVLAFAVDMRVHHRRRVQGLLPHLDAVEGMEHGDPPGLGLRVRGARLVDPKHICRG